MARSNFQTQSGPFALQLHSLNALPSEDPLQSSASPASSALVRNPQSSTIESWVDEKSDQSFRSFRSPPSPLAHRSSGEYYGFALFIFSTVLWVVWIGWALTPDEVLQSIGIAWYPNREWAFLIPAWSLFAVLATYAVFIGLNARNTPELEEMANVTDSAQNVLRIDMEDDKHLFEDDERYRQSLHDIYDLPPTYVSRQMHLV